MRFALGLSLPLLTVTLLSAAEPAPKSGKYWVFIGTYTGKGSKGIYRSELNLADGTLTAPELAAEVASPSFLAIHPRHTFLYAVGETGAGQKAGTVHAFALDAKSGELKAINTQSSGGAGPCHLIVDAAGKNVLLANYGGGSAEVLPIRADGGLDEPSCFVQHSGKGTDPGRQEGPHAHSINIDPAGRFAVVADLGLDQVRVYKYDAASGKITPNEPGYLKVADGSGPRHFAFHPTRPFAYVINEMACTVNALGFKDGAFEILQTISTLPHELRKGYSTAEVQVHPSGKFLYGSNRGQDSIVAFRIDPETGKLTLIGHQGDRIKTPRNFGIDPTGKYMIVANQDGNSIALFTIDPESGELKPTGNRVDVAMPVCIKFVPRPE